LPECSRKPIDDLDDTDDQDGVEEQEKRRDNDLKLRPRRRGRPGGVVEPDDDGTDDRR
jgi:hypothetical protein